MATQFAELVLLARSETVRTASQDMEHLREAGARADNSLAKSTGNINQGFNLMGAAAKKMAAIATAAFATLAAGASVTKAINLQMQFGSALAETSTLVDGSADEMAKLEAASRELAVTYGTSATQQAKAFYQAISAGAGDAAQSTDLLHEANKLAIGGITDTTTAVDILTTATNVYRAEGLRAADASDALFVAMKAGKTTIGELSSTLGKVLPLSQAVGLSFDETAAAVAALTKGGIATAEAVTGLRAILAAVNKPSSEARDLAKELSIEFNSAAIASKGLSGFLEDVADKTKGSNEAMALLFGGVEAIVPAMSLAGQSGVYLNEILGQMEEKTGAAARAFDLMSEDNAQRLNRAMAAINDKLLTLGATMLTAMVPAAEAAALVLTGLTENTDLFVIALGTLAAYQIPAAIAGLTALVTWLGTAEAMFIAGAVAARGMAIAMNLIPFVAVVAGVTAVYRAYNESQAAAENYTRALEGLTSAQDSLSDATTRYYSEVTQANLTAMTTSAQAAVQATKDAIAAAERELKAAQASFVLYNPFAGGRIKEAEAEIERLVSQLAEVEAQLSKAEHAQSNFNAMVERGTVAVEDTGDAITKMAGLYDTMLTDLDRQIEMQMAIAQHGEKSAYVAELRAEQERAIYAEKLSTLELTEDERIALGLVFRELQGVTAEAAAATANIGSGANEASRMAGNLASAANALSAVSGAVANMNITAVGLEAQNRALEAGNSLIDARTEGLIAAKRAELEPALGANAPDGMRAQAQRELEAYTEAVRRNSDAQERNAALVKAANAALNGGGSGGGGGAAKVAEDVLVNQRRAEDVLRDLERATLDAMSANDRHGMELRELAGLYQEGYLTAEQYANAVDMIDAQFREVQFEDFRKEISSVSDALATALLESGDFGDGIADIFDRIAHRILSSGIEEAIMQVFGALDGGGGGGGGFWSWLGGLFKPKALGGTVTAGHPYMVGERGPEPFFPAQNGRVLSTSQAQEALASEGGGRDVNVRVVGGPITLSDDGKIISQVRVEQVKAFRTYNRQMPARFNEIAEDQRQR